MTVDWGGLVTVPLLGLVGQPAEGWAGVGQGMLTVSKITVGITVVIDVEMVLTEKVGQAGAAVVRLLGGHEPVGLLPPSDWLGHEPQWPVLLVLGLMMPVPVASTGQMVVETATTSVLVTAWPLFLGQSLTSSGHWVTV